MADKNTSERRRTAFTAALASIGLGIGLLLYALGYNSDIIAAGLFIGAGIGLLMDSVMRNKK